MVDLRMYPLSFLSPYTMDLGLQKIRFTHVVHSDVTPTLVFFNNCCLKNESLIQLENKHF